jgi:hypothetical protein
MIAAAASVTITLELAPRVFSSLESGWDLFDLFVDRVSCGADWRGKVTTVRVHREKRQCSTIFLTLHSFTASLVENPHADLP